MLKRILIPVLLLFTLSSLRAQVIINELMAYNKSTLTNPVGGGYTDWIEIRNTGTVNVDLTGWSLSDEADDLRKWVFPNGTILSAGRVSLIWADDQEDSKTGLHASFKLSIAGETVYLTGKEGYIVDSLSFSRQFADVSYGPDNNGIPAYFPFPTPGNQNNYTSTYRRAAGIHFDPVPGIYQSAQMINLSWHDVNAVIRYTLDGTEPDENSIIYTHQILVNKNTVIRTRIWADGYLPGWTETATYIISPPLSLPVFSLVTDPVNLWDDVTGIYVEGTNGVTGYCSDTPKNYNQDWERPVSMEYFGRSAERILQIDGGIKIHGGCSRGFNMKSLVFFARSEYGANEINYKFFEEKDLDWFKSLIFRNSGNDFQYTMFRDGSIQAIAKGDMHVAGQAFQPSIVFLNGEYWGIHNLRERINENYISSNYNIPENDMDLLKSNWGVLAGDRIEYNKLLSYLDNHSLAVPANYQYVAGRIDIDEYINYLIAETYYANTDWPGNNQKYWRQRSTNGKWHWAIYDVDFSMGIYDFNPAIDMFTFVTEENGPDWPNPPWSTFLPRKLLESEEFRNKFISQYMMRLNTTFQPEHVIGVIDSLQDKIREAFPAHIARWGEPWSMEQWEANVEQLRNFARLRPDYVWESMCRFFSLGSVININVSADNNGLVMMNGYALPSGEFDGKTATGVPLDLEAYPSPGCRFTGWDVTTIDTKKATIVPKQSNWKYYDKGNYPGNWWTVVDFDDSSWPAGSGELGYGDGNEQTVLDFGPDENNKYMTYYFRKEVYGSSSIHCDNCNLNLLCDDGAVIYVNGYEILRVNLPEGQITYESPASNYVGGDQEFTYIAYHPEPFILQQGINIIAVEIHQSSGSSSDISFDMDLLNTDVTVGDTVHYSGSPLSLVPQTDLKIKAVFDTTTLLPDLLINEFMASNQSAYEDDYGESADWIEIFNAGRENVNIGGYYLTDDLGEPLKWQIPEGYTAVTTIPAGGFLVLFADEDTIQGPLHLDFRLDGHGESIGLSAIIKNVFHWIDTVTYNAQAIDHSCGRYPDGAQGWYPMDPFTPGTNNAVTAVPVVAEKAFSVDVYPNPAGDFAYLDINGLPAGTENRVDINLYDLTGRLLLSHNLQSTSGRIEGTLDLSGIPGGMYFLRVTAGTYQQSLRLVVRK